MEPAFLMSCGEEGRERCEGEGSREKGAGRREQGGGSMEQGAWSRETGERRDGRREQAECYGPNRVEGELLGGAPIDGDEVVVRLELLAVVVHLPRGT
jgi:hypothetical protein